MIGYTYFVHIWPNLRLSVGFSFRSIGCQCVPNTQFFYIVWPDIDFCDDLCLLQEEASFIGVRAIFAVGTRINI